MWILSDVTRLMAIKAIILFYWPLFLDQAIIQHLGLGVVWHVLVSAIIAFIAYTISTRVVKIGFEPELVFRLMEAVFVIGWVVIFAHIGQDIRHGSVYNWAMVIQGCAAIVLGVGIYDAVHRKEEEEMQR